MESKHEKEDRLLEDEAYHQYGVNSPREKQKFHNERQNFKRNNNGTTMLDNALVLINAERGKEAAKS